MTLSNLQGHSLTALQAFSNAIFFVQLWQHLTRLTDILRREVSLR